MDTRAHQRIGARGDGLVTDAAGAAVKRSVFAASVLVLLASAVAGGLLRAGVPLAGGVWLPRSAVWHAALMICGFMGTVIGVERAVAVKTRNAWAAPLASAFAIFALLAGADTAGRVLLCVAAASFAVVNFTLVRRQPAAHTRLLLAAAWCWLAGNVLFLFGQGAAAIAWWFAFLVWTVAAERLEMTRLMPRRAAAAPALAAILALMGAGAAIAPFVAAAGHVAYGISLVALAAWLVLFDVTRVTIRSRGLPRYMAVCLLAGYAWLAVAGICWAAAALGAPSRDAALHALGIGFIFSMIMGHAPVILPAVVRVKLLFGRAFYLPLALLHISLLVRLGPGAAHASWRAAGAVLNAASLLVFAAVILVAALRWKRQKG